MGTIEGGSEEPVVVITSPCSLQSEPRGILTANHHGNQIHGKASMSLLTPCDEGGVEADRMDLEGGGEDVAACR